MLWVALGVIGVVLLVIGAVVTGFVALVFAPHREAPSPGQLAALIVLTTVALVALPFVAANVNGAWFTVPIVGWLAGVSIIRNSAPVRETEQQRKARQSEEKKRAAARQRIHERERATLFGRDGLAMMDRAKAAVNSVMATKAAHGGWLGEPGSLDFSVDLATIADTLQRARRIERLVDETTKIPQPTADDTEMLRDAERKLKQLRGEVMRRVQVLNDCAIKAQQLDRALIEEERQRRQAVQRDDARSRLAAELYGVEATPPVSASDATDAVSAHVAAFHELKGTIEDQRQVEIGAVPVVATDGNPPSTTQNALAWIRRQLPFDEVA